MMRIHISQILFCSNILETLWRVSCTILKIKNVTHDRAEVFERKKEK